MPFAARPLLGLLLAAVSCVSLAAAQTPALFTISAPSPAAASAGSGALKLSLTVQPNIQVPLAQYGFCLFTGIPSNPVARSSTSSATNPTFAVPASNFDIPPASFVSGQYTAYLNLQIIGTPCAATSTVSNSIPFPISYPTLSSVSLAAIPQPNPGVAYATYPSSLEITGANLNPGSGATFTFLNSTSGSSPLFQPGTFLPAAGAIIVPLPAQSSSGATAVSLSACNNSVHYRYCSAAASLSSFALATTTTQLTSSVAAPLAGAPTTLTATITPGPGSTTPGGIFVPGVPSGLVTFSDGGIPLGTAPLVGSSLTFATASPQTITAPSDVSARLRATARTRPRPSDTPAPDLSSGFSSILADFNRDGALDALILDSNSGTMHVLLATAPTGNFRADRPISTAPPCFTGVTVADLNGDGFPDIAFLCPANNNGTQLFALVNQGDGTFAPPVPILGPSGTNILAAGTQLGSGDFNRDGKTDLVVTGPTTASDNPAFGLQIFFGDGTGNFAVGPVTPTASDPGTQLLVQDLNHDGSPDLVLLSSSPQTFTTAVQTYVNDGTGNFTPAASLPVCNCFTATAKLFVAPLTANTAYPDLTVALPDQQQILVALNQRSPTLSFAAPTTLSFSNLADAVLGDLNGDGLPDLVLFNGSTLTVLNGNGAGNFAPQPSSPTFTASAANVSLAAAADFNQDGFADLLTIYPGAAFTSTVNTYITTGSSVATLPATFATPGPHALTTAYPGNTNLLGSAGTLSLNVLSTQTNTATFAVFAPPATAPGTSASQTYTPGGTFALSFTLTQALSPTQSQPTLTPTGIITVSEGGSLLASVSLTASALGTSTAALPSFGSATAGVHLFTIAYSGDTNFLPITLPYTFTITPATPVIAYNPTPSTITFGTLLTQTQLTATAATSTGISIPGRFTFNHAAGDLLPAGMQTLTATFTPTDSTSFTSATRSAVLTVTRFTPLIAFPTPPIAVVGTPLSTLQLTPTITGATGSNLPGTLSFTPTTGLVIAGPQVLTVTFSPTDTVDYTLATTTVTLTGTPLTLTALSASSGLLGDPAKTITLTGTGFVANSSVRANGSPLVTTFVNSTTLTAVLPASTFLTLQTLQISVFNPTQNLTSASLPFTVAPAPITGITFSGPAISNSGDQPIIQFALTNPYPVGLTVNLALAFTPIAGGVDDPAIQFRAGGRTYSFNLAAGQTAAPTIQLQTGTVAGTIRVTLAITLTGTGVDVTPSSVTPILITIPPAAPGITSITLTRSGRQLTVNSFGFSNTRAVTQAHFHFTPAAGQQIQNQDITLDVTSLFTGWYTEPASATYGSGFLYTQTFTLDDDATVVGQVTLTLSNGIGASASGSSN